MSPPMCEGVAVTCRASLLVLSLIAGCTEPAAEPDAGVADLGAVDGGPVDGGPVDHGAPDGGSDGGVDGGRDAGSSDAGLPVVAFTGRVLVAPEGFRPSSTALVGVLSGSGSVWDRMAWSDPRDHRVERMEGCPDACRSVTLLEDPETQPVRFTEVDLDGDGILERVVVDIGILWPSEDASGQLLVLDPAGGSPTVLREGLRRPVCLRDGDLDADGDVDLVVCAFGHTVGRLFWMERLDDGTYAEHDLHTRPGTIEAIPVDIDDDDDLDVVSIVSQLDEMVLLHRNDGAGGFEEVVLLDRPETYYGMSGLEVTDLDGDGDPDLVITNGDTLDHDLPEGVEPEAHYGIAWMENDGAGGFEWHEITRLWGAYTARAGDLDLDGDLDLVVANHQLGGYYPELVVRNMVWLENEGGAASFVLHTIDEAPEQLMTLHLEDVEGDGDLDVLTGSMHLDGRDLGRRLFLLENTFY